MKKRPVSLRGDRFREETEPTEGSGVGGKCLKTSEKPGMLRSATVHKTRSEFATAAVVSGRVPWVNRNGIYKLNVMFMTLLFFRRILCPWKNLYRHKSVMVREDLAHTLQRVLR